ncbi:alpha/beta hydrolase family protein [Salinimicrobium flavum]|uniref:Alpha/beta hydrolase family protein n=1 Tax=Salinimicrobium flavum TaxID=1737065 RepID=A0ABW5IVK4_9FLAO
MKYNLFILFLIFTTIAIGQETPLNSEEVEVDKYVKGTLLTPATETSAPLVLLIQGSGPTDRNGNQSFMKNDSFKKLANELAREGIASFRFDKRILHMSKLGIKEEDIRFENFIEDASSAVDHFRTENRFSKVIILGHSQGSLVGMVVAKEKKADAFISIAGASKTIDSIITSQVALQMPSLSENVEQSFRDLRESGSSRNYDPMLEMIFRPSVQPFILSWMKYDPKEKITDLDMPLLLINGTKDLQISEQEAQSLKRANPDAELLLIENMNHVLRNISGSELENSKSYNEPGLPLHPQLTPAIVEFIKKL